MEIYEDMLFGLSSILRIILALGLLYLLGKMDDTFCKK